MTREDFDKLRAKLANECLIIGSENKAIQSAMRLAKKKGNLRFVARVPLSALTIHPESRKYFDPAMDVHERNKNIDLFLNRFNDHNNFDLRKV